VKQYQTNPKPQREGERRGESNLNTHSVWKRLRILLFICESMFVSFERTHISSNQGNRSNDPNTVKEKLPNLEKLIIKASTKGFICSLSKKIKIG
jgi:hypothetical protein